MNMHSNMTKEKPDGLAKKWAEPDVKRLIDS